MIKSTSFIPGLKFLVDGRLLPLFQESEHLWFIDRLADMTNFESFVETMQQHAVTKQSRLK